jgi:phosphoribosylamine--glycine ligase
MKILLIGSGGREHALAYRLASSPKCGQLFIAPGNPGTFQCGKNIDIMADNLDGLLDFALSEGIDLTVVGPEQPLSLGIVDLFQSHGLVIVGPNREASQLEGSKAWAKDRYRDYGIPTADYQVFREYNSALHYVNCNTKYPIVIKADGLAAGKGVVIAHTLTQAKKALSDCFIDKVFDAAGASVVIEEFLEGEEVSIFAITDGKTVLPLTSAQDHKAIFDGDKGPNTGGMGAYSPAPIATSDIQQKVMDRVLVPLIDGFKNDGINYKGILYAGLMINPNGDPYVVEFNIRFGDPEAQVVLPRLTTDVVDVFMAISQETLGELHLDWRPGFTVGVVMASKGYPGTYNKGDIITGLLESSDDSTYVFHAGTHQTERGDYVTNGGRVLTVCADGESLNMAISSAYKRCETISFSGAYYRKDIAQKGLTRLTSPSV